VHSSAPSYAASTATSSSSAAASAPPPPFHFEVHVFDCHHSDCCGALSTQPTVYHGANAEVVYCLEQAMGDADAAFALHESRCASVRSGSYGGSRPGPPQCFVCGMVPTPMDPVSLVSCSGHQCLQQGYTYCLPCHRSSHLLSLKGVHSTSDTWGMHSNPPRPSSLSMARSNFGVHAKSITDDGRRALFSSTFQQLSMLEAFSACPALREMHIGGKCEYYFPPFLLQ
jgi:hypothetical protein